jgi:hypothetical protein
MSLRKSTKRATSVWGTWKRRQENVIFRDPLVVKSSLGEIRSNFFWFFTVVHLRIVCTVKHVCESNQAPKWPYFFFTSLCNLAWSIYIGRIACYKCQQHSLLCNNSPKSCMLSISVQGTHQPWAAWHATSSVASLIWCMLWSFVVNENKCFGGSPPIRNVES